MAQFLKVHAKDMVPLNKRIQSLDITDLGCEQKVSVRPAIPWSMFDQLFEGMSASDSFYRAVKRVQEDRELFNCPEMRIHWFKNSVLTGKHPDGTKTPKRGRMLVCYTPPTTKGWHPSQQHFTSGGRARINNREADSFFEFSVGHIWRHACGNDRGNAELGQPIPLVHEASVPKNGMPRIIMVDSGRSP